MIVFSSLANFTLILYSMIMTTPEKRDFTALKTMIEKLDNRRQGDSGYVTYLPELKAILDELSPLVSVGILRGSGGGIHPDDTDTVDITIKFGITLSRSELE